MEPDTQINSTTTSTNTPSDPAPTLLPTLIPVFTQSSTQQTTAEPKPEPTIEATPEQTQELMLQTSGRSTAGTQLFDISYTTDGKIVHLAEQVDGEYISWDYVYDNDGSFLYRKKNIGDCLELQYESTDTYPPSNGKLAISAFTLPVKNCVGFTVLYEVTKLSKGDFSGTRDMCIRLQNGTWKIVGSFAYDNMVRSATTFSWTDPVNLDAFCCPRQVTNGSWFTEKLYLTDIWVADYQYVDLEREALAEILEPTPVPTPKWTVVEEPGCETTGIKERANPNDPSNPEREIIPALGHDWQPATYYQPETCSRCGKQQGSPLQPPPGPSDMAGYSGIQAPQSTSWLAARETRYVYAPHGAAVYIYKGPSFGYEKVNGNYGVADGTELTLLALENGMYLVKTGNGLLGWINSSGTIETRLIDTMPQLTGSYWIYSKGTGDAYTYACKFDSGLKLVGFRLSDGKKMAWTCRLAGRVLVIDKTKFIWDGEQFAYETQAFLWVDPDQTFDKYS